MFFPPAHSHVKGYGVGTVVMGHHPLSRFFFRFPVGFHPWSIAFSNRSCAAALAGVVALALTPFGVLTRTFPLFSLRFLTGITPSMPGARYTALARSG